MAEEHRIGNSDFRSEACSVSCCVLGQAIQALIPSMKSPSVAVKVNYDNAWEVLSSGLVLRKQLLNMSYYQ